MRGTINNQFKMKEGKIFFVRKVSKVARDVLREYLTPYKQIGRTREKEMFIIFDSKSWLGGGRLALRTIGSVFIGHIVVWFLLWNCFVIKYPVPSISSTKRNIKRPKLFPFSSI